MEEQCDTASDDSMVASRRHVTTAFYLYFREIAESTACRPWPFVLANAPLAAPLGVAKLPSAPVHLATSPEASHVVDEVRHSDLASRANDAEGAHDLGSHRVLLMIMATSLFLLLIRLVP